MGIKVFLNMLIVPEVLQLMTHDRFDKHVEGVSRTTRDVRMRSHWLIGLSQTHHICHCSLCSKLRRDMLLQFLSHLQIQYVVAELSLALTNSAFK